MGHRDFGLALVPILALLAIFVPAAAPSRVEDGAVPAGAPAAKGEAVETPSKNAGALLAAYYGSAYNDTSATPADLPLAQACLIATLPDPIDAANLSYTYDRYLDAIQRAMEASDYVLDRFDVPWNDADAATAADPRYRKEPARLLFRQATRTGVSPTALVFVVGETPTAGIHKRAFDTAMAELSVFCAEHAARREATSAQRGPAAPVAAPAVQEPPPARKPWSECDLASQPATSPESKPDTAPTVKVLGPSFSGSQHSLRALVLAHPAWHFTIVTGSATAVNAGTVLCGAAGSTFKATVAPDAEARDLFLWAVARRERVRSFQRFRTLLRLPPRPIKVALLIETNTVFGQAAAATPEVSYPASIQLITLPFPLHISSLRAVSRESAGPKGGDTEVPVGGAPLTELNLREKFASRTTVPLMSQAENSSMEITLATLLEDLEKEHVRYIGLVATDVKDRLFLAQRIRHHLPNSVLFMFSADLLYVHPEVNVDMRGAQIVTSYPLYTGNSDWTPGPQGTTSKLLFPTHTTQGVYNAALVLLGMAGRMQEYGYPLDPAARRPPLWLSVVGSKGLQPVALLGEPSGAVMIDAPSRRSFAITGVARDVPIPNHPWLPTVALLVCVLPAAFVLYNFAPSRPAWLPHFGSGPLAQLFNDSIFDRHKLRRRLYLFACCSALTSMYVLTTATFMLPRVTNLRARMRGGLQLESSVLAQPAVVVLIAGAIVMVATLWLLARAVWEGCRQKAAGGPLVCGLARGSVAIGTVLVLLSGWVAGAWLMKRDPAETLLLYLRSSDFGSGVSPLLPLVLIASAAIAWSISSLRRLLLIEGPDQFTYGTGPGKGSPNSFLGLEGASFEGIACLERAVLDAIGRCSADLPMPVVGTFVGVLVVAWWRLFGPGSVPTGEGVSFDALFALGFLVIYAVLGLSVLRFVFAWRRLLRLLQRLAWHPTVKAYARLRKSIPGKPKVNLTSPSQILTALEFSVDRAGELAALGRDLTKAKKPARPAVDPVAALTRALEPLMMRLPGGAAELPRDEVASESAAVTAVREGFTARLSVDLPALEAYVSAAEGSLHAALDADARGDWREKVRHRTDAERQLALMAIAVTNLVRPAWRLPATGAPERGKDEPNEFQWFELAEDFLTSRVAAFLSHVVPQLQNQILFATVGLLLMLLAATSYPFQPHQTLLMFNTMVILSVVGATLVVFVQMERETILSVLSESEPGQITWNRDFVSRIGVYILLPIISLLGAQFPEVSQQLFTWASSFFGSH